MPRNGLFFPHSFGCGMVSHRRRWKDMMSIKNQSLRFWVVFLIGIFVVSGARAVAAEPSTWTSVSGATVEAAIVNVQADMVVLQTVDGDEVSIRINMLIPQDQVRAREWQAGRTTGDDMASAGEGGEGREDQLPTLPDEGHYAIYQADNFDAVIHRNGIMTVHPKVDGQRYGESFRFAIPMIQYEDREGSTRVRPTEFVRWDAPARNPQRIAYEATRKEPSPGHLSVEYSFEGNQITAVIQLLEPRRAASGLSGFSVSRFTPLIALPPAYNVQQRRRALEDHSVVYRDERGRSETPSLLDTDLRAVMDEVTFKGFWGPRVITISGDNRTRGNSTRIWTYPGKPIHEDFRIRWAVEAGARPGRLVLTVE